MLKAKLSIAIALVAVLVLLSPAAYADTGGTASGSFGAASSTPQVTAVNIYAPSDPNCTGSPITDMTPQTEWYYAKVSVTSNSKLKHLETVSATLFYNDGSDPNMPAPGSGDVHDVAILTCTVGTATWTSDFGGSSTWDLNQAGCLPPVSLEATSGDWIFAFKPGTVARENIGAAMWNVQGYAQNKTDGKHGDRYVRDKNMMWYGGITVNTPSVDWGEAPLGLTFDQDTVNGNPQTDISVKYIANGDYYENVNSSENWTGFASSEIVALDGTGGDPPLDDSQFALKGNDVSDNTTWVIVQTSYNPIDSTGAMTEESGNTELANTLWLSLSAAGITPDRYDGEIHYQIENR